MSGLHDIENGVISADTIRFRGGLREPPRSRIADSTTLGTFCFASTTLMSAFFNLHTRNINTPNAIVGMAIFTGGLGQLLAGIWQFPVGNVFGAAVFSSYGVGWMSYATVLIPASGIIDSYAGNEAEFRNAMGIFNIVWALSSFFFLIAAHRESVCLVVMLTSVTTTYVVLAVGQMSNDVHATIAGGAFQFISSFLAYYVGLSKALAWEGATFPPMPLGTFQKRIDPATEPLQPSQSPMSEFCS